MVNLHSNTADSNIKGQVQSLQTHKEIFKRGNHDKLGGGGMRTASHVMTAFSLPARTSGEGFDDSFANCAFFFYKWESACEYHQVSLTSGALACFLDKFPTLCLDSKVSPLWLCRVKGVRVLRCNPSPALSAEWQGSFTCHCSNVGWNRHRIRVSIES